MWGLIVGGLIAGTVVLVRIIRRTRTGRRIGDALQGLTTAEKASLAFASLVFTLVGLMVASAWVAWQIENARIIAGVEEPRQRPDPDRASAADRVRTITVPSITIPDVSVPTFPERPAP